MRIFLPIFLFFVLQMSAQSLHIADSYYKLGKFDNAILAYESILQKNPTNTHAITGLAKSYRQTEAYVKAENLLKSAYAKQPNQLDFLLELGVTYSQSKRETLASQTFDRILVELDKVPNIAGYIGRLFKNYNLISYTIKSYEKMKPMKYFEKHY